MKVVRHSDPDAFLAAATPMAARGEASASFFITWAHAMKRTPPSAAERVYMATCSDGAVMGAAIQRDEGPVIIGRSDIAAARAFAADLAGDLPALCGVMGSPAPAEAFAQTWSALTGRGHRVRVRLLQHRLGAVNEVPRAPGAARVATEADLDWLAARHAAFIVETGVHDSPERVAAMLPRRVSRGDFRIWEDGARVAFVGYNDAAPEFARVAPVYTEPDRRRRGYATALVALLSRELIARGKRALFLTTDAANPVSNSVYARIGYRVESDDCALDFVSP